MGRQLFLSLALVVATWPALPQETPAPIQTAQAEEKPPAVEPAVVLPESGVSTAVLIGVAAVVGLALLPLVCCSYDDSGGLPPTATAPTGTR